MMYACVKGVRLSAGLARSLRSARSRASLAKIAWAVAHLGALIVVLACFSAGVRAQDVAAVTGTVNDKVGGFVSGANIKLTDSRNGATYTATTGDDGSYKIVKVQPGPGYVLTVSKDGFETTTISNLYLPIATTTTQNIILSIGSINQSVEVTAQGSVSLNTTDSTIGNNFDIRAVSSLPNEFRGNAANLLRLEPAVVSADVTNTYDDQGLSRNGAVAGARADQDNITVDGIDASDFAFGQSFREVAPTPVDAIQEFRTEVANPLADVGRGSGAQTIITTKSGTNQWHGNAREYHRNTITEANDFFNNKNGIPRPTLIRNQFGGNLGGPIKKDKLFFFFDYDGRRDASQKPALDIVPLAQVHQGEIGYINNNPGCTASSTLQSTPQCISFATPAQVAALDPCSNPAAAPGPCTLNGQAGGTPVTPGLSPQLLALFNARYPLPNDLAAGDGINSGGLLFNAPAPNTINTYTTRVDYDLTSKQKLFTRFSFYNQHTVQSQIPSIQFPGDPITNPLTAIERSWVIGHTWTFNSNVVNQFWYGESRAEQNTIATLTGPANPGGDQSVWAGLNWLLGTPITQAYARPGGIDQLFPVPTFRDDVSWQKGKHSFQFGGVYRPIKTRTVLVNNFNFPAEGLILNNLDPTLRPANILNDPNGVAALNWDSYFTGLLGIESFQFTNNNYIKTGAVAPQGTGSRRDYRYYEAEAYAQDSWRIRPDLTIVLGLRYGYDSVPYEINGNEAIPQVTLANLLSARVAAGLNGLSGPTSTPLLTYGLAGKGNSSAPSLYNADPFNFSPRVALAWNPGFRNGFLSNLFGDRKTVLRAGFAQIYDHTALSVVDFIEDQSNYVFSSTGQFAFTGTGTAASYLAGSPRFTSIGAATVNIPPAPFQSIVTPNTSGSGSNIQVFGTQQGTFGNFVLDHNYKTPYSYAISFGLQRELPGNFQLELDYIGRFAHRLGGLADGGQVVNFVDPTSQQSLVGALTILEQEARAGVPTSAIQPLPFFENQMTAAGAGCAPGCTQQVYANNLLALQQGNLFGVNKVLLQQQLLPENVGIAPQFASDYYFANKSWSNYNGLVTILRKRLSRNVQMDFNYTFSHSIDNFSGIANNVGNAFFNAQSVSCDAIDLNTCKGNSEFDVKHQISGDVIYDLPFGRGQWIARNSPGWLNQIIGGWQVSGIYTWRTGFAFPVLDNAQTLSMGSTAYPIFTGNESAITVNPHTDTNLNGNGIQLFANPTAALGAFSAPTGLEVGTRDELRGPHFGNADLALAKSFPLWNEKYKLQFRTEAYNAFNHTNFGLPSSINIANPNFGQITTTASTSGDQSARVLQFALRLDF
jgi:Carboxypeptidase regulatory-like domain/TonB dependent receptor